MRPDSSPLFLPSPIPSLLSHFPPFPTDLLWATFNASLLSLHTDASSPSQCQEVGRLVWRLTFRYWTREWLCHCRSVRCGANRREGATAPARSARRSSTTWGVMGKPGVGRTQALSRIHWTQVSGLLTHSPASRGLSEFISDRRLCPWHNVIVKGLIHCLTQHSNDG